MGLNSIIFCVQVTCNKRRGSQTDEIFLHLTTTLFPKDLKQSLLIANDPNPERAQRLRSNLLRCGVLRCLVTELPGDELCSATKGVFDAILVDAPCSAEGNCRRDRRALERWRNGREGSPKLLRRQAELLRSAWKALKPGGYMVYSTCTFNYFENELQCQQFVSSVPNIHIVDLSVHDWGCSLSGAESRYLRVWPQSFDTEGFFVAAFQKIEPTLEPIDLPMKWSRFPPHLRLLDWRRVPEIRRRLHSEGFFLPEDKDLALVEDEQQIYLVPRPKHHLEPLLGKLKSIGIPIADKKEDSFVTTDELLLWAGDRCPQSSKMTLSDWAALEINLCDSLAARNAHLSLLAAEGQTQRVYEGFSSMLQCRWRPDGASFAALVTALVTDGRDVLAQDVSLTKTEGTEDVLRLESFNKVLHAFAVSGDHSSIRRMMSAMRERRIVPDVVSYNTLLKSLMVKKAMRSEEDASKFLQEMSSCSVRPNKITFSTLMSSIAKQGDPKAVERLMKLAEHSGVEVGVFGFNILIQAHMTALDLSSSYEVLRQMRQQGLKPDVVTYTTLMKGQTEDKVVALFHEMQKDLLQPNSVSLTSLISTLSKSQQRTAAMKIAKENINFNEEISSHLASAILHLCATSDETTSAALASTVFRQVPRPDAACRHAYRKAMAARLDRCEEMGAMASSVLRFWVGGWVGIKWP